jgi:hypothetical protein
MKRTNRRDGAPARSGQPATPPIRAAAVLKHIKRWPHPVPDVKTVAVHCGRCGQGLVDLLHIPCNSAFPRDSSSNPPSVFFRPPPVPSPNDLYILWCEVHGWRWDGTTLRPTRYHLEQQQRAQQDVWAKPRTETKRLRQSLANHGPHRSGKYFTRPLGKQGDPRHKLDVVVGHQWAPEWIECPQCKAEVHVAPT